jgi:hypothetical protein
MTDLLNRNKWFIHIYRGDNGPFALNREPVLVPGRTSINELFLATQELVLVTSLPHRKNRGKVLFALILT